MKKFFNVLALAAVALIVIPSCSTSDSLDEVIEASDLDVSATTGDAEDKNAIPFMYAEGVTR